LSRLGSRRGVIALALMSASACGGPSIRPDPVSGLTLTCPSNRSVESPNGGAVTVTFDQPQASGGAAPVTTTCTPQSGTQFAVGSTSVACQARDASSQVASCGFSVAVQATPQLQAARFLAFGDSITAGVVSEPLSMMIVSPPESYPFVLQDRLGARYRQQSPIVVNEGNPGELASLEGIQRFRSVLLRHRPEIVLIMEGTNDLGFAQNGSNVAINALRAMIVEARSQQVRLALATIPPQRAGGAKRRDATAMMVPAFNDRVRALAGSEGVPLFDVYQAMKDDPSLIGIDDLHPTPRGYDVMAGVFFEGIRTHFETRPAFGWRAQ
jgi:lysophospholipase L1-like esterase